MHRNTLAAVVVLLFTASTATACLWDYDTLLMERRRFPGVVEMISGKFLRHSPEFYEWRIHDREEKLKADPNRLDWYDDLAVAYSKTGDHKKAIEIIQQKDKLKPGLYETEANWGTFLLFDGQWEEGLKHVNRALEINPDAHFGRERYQALLIEYVIPRLKDGKPQFPLAAVVIPDLPRDDGFDKESFTAFLKRKLGPKYDRQAAVTAVLGMMHFADYRSPVLLEPLASLMTDYHSAEGEQRLASRAYLKASQEVGEPLATQAYLEQAKGALTLQENRGSFEAVQADLTKEIREADEWYASLRDAEMSWIRDGKDPEAEFLKRYPVDPETTIPWRARVDEFFGTDTSQGRFRWGFGLFLGAMLFLLALFVRQRRRRRIATGEL